MGVNNKIAVFCNYELLPDRIGGMDYFFCLFDKKCKENAIEVDWFFPNNSSHELYKNLNIVDCKYNNIEHFFYHYNLQNSQKYNFIITHFTELCSPIFKKIKKHTQSQIIQVDHNPRPINGYSLKKRIVKKIKGFFYSKYTDVFIAVSEYSKNQIIKEFGWQINSKSKVIFNGIKADNYLKKSNFNFKGKFIVACHLRKDKGVQDLILAVNELQKQQPIHFIIDVFGKGYYQPVLQQMIDEFSLNHVFKFKGSVSNLNELFHQYDYLIHPSHGETFCFSVVESLMCKLPVITTKNHGNVLGLVVDNKNGFLFSETDSKQLSHILKNCIDNEVVCSDFSSSNQFLQNLTIEFMVENYFKLIQ